MRIDYRKESLAESELDSFVSVLLSCREVVEEESRKLKANSGTDEIILRMERILKCIDSQMLAARMMKQSLSEAAEAFRECEQMIILYADNGITEKTGLALTSSITSAADFEWRII